MKKQALTVTELTKGIKQLLELNFGQICLLGEISNLARPSSGHLYFKVKDEGSQIDGVMFRSSAQRSRFALENGMEVFLFGRVTVYEPRGTYQIIVDRIEPFGTGALQLAFEQLKEKLLLEGLFEENQKKEIPYIPKGIGIVTSPTGAAIQDMLNILSRRFEGIPVLINPVSVQGDTAAGEIARAIEQLNQRKEIDVIIIGRGGGSIEDLWAFNEEVVARAIFASNMPIVSAVGHEIDFTIADFVADLRAPTPSAAAELVVPVKDELIEHIEDLYDRLETNIVQAIEWAKERVSSLRSRLRSPESVVGTYLIKVDELTSRLRLNLENTKLVKSNKLESLNRLLHVHSPQSRIDNKRTELTDLKFKMQVQIEKILNQKKNKFAELTRVLDSLSPLSTMSRGFSIVKSSSGKIVSSVDQAKPGGKLKVQVTDGEIVTKVEEIKPIQVKSES